MSKNGPFPKTLEHTTAFRSRHRRAGCWPVRRAEGPHTGVPKYFTRTPTWLLMQSAIMMCVSVRSRDRLPANHNPWKRSPGFSCDLIKQTHLLIKQITGSGILILSSNKGLDVYIDVIRWTDFVTTHRFGRFYPSKGVWGVAAGQARDSFTEVWMYEIPHGNSSLPAPQSCKLSVKAVTPPPSFH